MIIIDLLITMVAYMIYPFVKFKLGNKNIQYTKEQINKTCIINSIVWAVIFLIIGVNSIENYEPNFVPAFIWYCINYSFFTYSLSKKSDTINKTTSGDTWQEYLENNYKATGTRTNIQPFMKKFLIIVVLIIFSFIFVAIQSSFFVPMIVESTQCECNPCTLEGRLDKYINNSNNIEKNDANVILLFMGYAWIVTLLIDIIIYNKIKNIQFKITTKNKEQQENDLLYKIIPITVVIGVILTLVILFLIPEIIN